MRTQTPTSVKESPRCRTLANHRVGCGGRTRFSNESTTPSQQHEVHPGHQDSSDRGRRGWRSRLSLHCCHGWSDNGDEHGGLLEPAQEERKQCSNWSKSSGEGHARAHVHEFPKLVQLLRASQSCLRSTSQITTQKALSTCKHCEEEASLLQKHGSSRSEQRPLCEICRTSTKQVL